MPSANTILTACPAPGTPAGVQAAPFDQLSLPSFQSLFAENAGTAISHKPAKTSPRKLHDIRESPTIKKSKSAPNRPQPNPLSVLASCNERKQNSAGRPALHATAK